MISHAISRRIYNELNNGRTVNRSLYDEGREKDNPLYHELMHNKIEYTEMYDALGYELNHGDGFFFIKEADNADPHREATVKIVALLSVLGQATMLLGYRYSLLVTGGAGFSEEMAKEVSSNEEFTDILAAVGLKADFWHETKSVLIDRRITYLNSAGRMLLSESGQAFFFQLFNEITEDTNEQSDT